VLPKLEPLEDRNLLSSYTANTVTDLINDITAANRAGGTNTIALAANTTFTLAKVNNKVDGPTGLPVIAAGDTLTIAGNGAVLERSTVTGTATFRLFDVASGAALTLENLTLQNGAASGSGVEAEGGAIYNQDTLVLDGVTVQQNYASGSTGAPATKQKVGEQGQSARGGGIWSSGVLTLENRTLIQNNTAWGGQGGMGILVHTPYYNYYTDGGSGGTGFGGGVYVAGGTVRATNVTLSGNRALGGPGGVGGFDGAGVGGGLFVVVGTVNLNFALLTSNTAENGGAGGGIYVAGGTVTLSNDSVASNTAADRNGYRTYGGGIYIASGATVYLDSSTVTQTMNNTASIGPDIYGTYYPS
jgi:hypothetical protein